MKRYEGSPRGHETFILTDNEQDLVWGSDAGATFLGNENSSLERTRRSQSLRSKPKAQARYLPEGY